MTSNLKQQITFMFGPLDKKSAAGAFPVRSALSSLLASRCHPFDQTAVAARPRDMTLFATAAIEMWLRAIHSFLISASLTDASPIWSSVAGYYSSHYCMRAFAHLFGLFHLHKNKRLIQLSRQGNGWVFEIIKKDGRHGEHTLYWEYLAKHPELIDDPFFYPNREDLPISDGSHRNRANYADHLNIFPQFRPLNEEFLAQRIQKIAEIQFTSIPTPNADKFPDLASVQILAYHRIVRFRKVVDEVIGAEHRFWSVHRNPPWRPKTLTFQVVDPEYTAIYAGRA